MRTISDRTALIGLIVVTIVSLLILTAIGQWINAPLRIGDWLQLSDGVEIRAVDAITSREYEANRRDYHILLLLSSGSGEARRREAQARLIADPNYARIAATCGYIPEGIGNDWACV